MRLKLLKSVSDSIGCGIGTCPAKNHPRGDPGDLLDADNDAIVCIWGSVGSGVYAHRHSVDHHHRWADGPLAVPGRLGSHVAGAAVGVKHEGSKGQEMEDGGRDNYWLRHQL